MTFVTYDEITLNVGDGLNGHTGLFTASQREIYFISFAALKQWNTIILCVQPKHNNVTLVTRKISADPEDPVSHMQWTTLNLQSTLLVEAGNTVGVYLNNGVLYDTNVSSVSPKIDANRIYDIDGKPITDRNTVFTGYILQIQ